MSKSTNDKSTMYYSNNKPTAYTTERFHEWRCEASDEDMELYGRMYDFIDYFNDMLFDEDSSTFQFIEEDGFRDIPDVLANFTYEFFTVKVESSEEYSGQYNHLERCLRVVPEHLDNDSTILHEMIHLHEYVLNDFGKEYSQIVVLALYQDLLQKVEEPEMLIKAINFHMCTGRKNIINSVGGKHDVLFLLKSFELDERMGYKAGTVFGYSHVGGCSLSDYSFVKFKPRAKDMDEDEDGSD